MGALTFGSPSVVIIFASVFSFLLQKVENKSRLGYFKGMFKLNELTQMECTPVLVKTSFLFRDICYT